MSRAGVSLLFCLSIYSLPLHAWPDTTKLGYLGFILPFVANHEPYEMAKAVQYNHRNKNDYYEQENLNWLMSFDHFQPDQRQTTITLPFWSSLLNSFCFGCLSDDSTDDDDAHPNPKPQEQTPPTHSEPVVYIPSGESQQPHGGYCFAEVNGQMLALPASLLTSGGSAASNAISFDGGIPSITLVLPAHQGQPDHHPQPVTELTANGYPTDTTLTETPSGIGHQAVQSAPNEPPSYNEIAAPGSLVLQATHQLLIPLSAAPQFYHDHEGTMSLYFFHDWKPEEQPSWIKPSDQNVFIFYGNDIDYDALPFIKQTKLFFLRIQLTRDGLINWDFTLLNMVFQARIHLQVLDTEGHKLCSDSVVVGLEWDERNKYHKCFMDYGGRIAPDGFVEEFLRRVTKGQGRFLFRIVLTLPNQISL